MLSVGGYYISYNSDLPGRIGITVTNDLGLVLAASSSGTLAAESLGVDGGVSSGS